MRLYAIKRAAIATGLYEPIRTIRRHLSRSQRDEFSAATSFYGQFIKPGDLCFDIGANVGAKTEIFLALGAKVIAVEPQPKMYEILSARSKRYSDRVKLLRCGVSDKEGEMVLYFGAHDGKASLYNDWCDGDFGKINVPVTTLDSIINSYGVPHFLKIDVEGHELGVLGGLSHRIPLTSIEYHTNEKDAAAARACISRIAARGPVEINFTGMESHKLISEKWISVEDFYRVFPSCVSQFFFGDIIVRTL